MYLSRLKLFQFRNLGNQALEFPQGFVVLVGNNGNGKTNLVEAISILGLGRSFRTSSYDELPEWGANSFSVFGQVESGEGDVELGVSWEKKIRKVYIDGKPLPSASDFIGRFPCVSFSPNDLSLIKSGPQLRRKFIDKYSVDTKRERLRPLLEYQRALKNKTSILKSSDANRKSLEIWNELLAVSAVEIHRARKEFIADLNKKLMVTTKFARVDGDIRLELRSTIVKEEPTTVENVLRRMNDVTDRELLLRAPLIGPHRDEIEISFGGRGARAFASQGQTRSIVLAMTLAVVDLIHEERAEAPVLLLDDIDSELDSGRAEALFSQVMEREGQIFLTGTRVPISINEKDRRVTVFNLDQGIMAAA